MFSEVHLNLAHSKKVKITLASYYVLWHNESLKRSKTMALATLILFQRGSTSWGYQIGSFYMYWPKRKYWATSGWRPTFGYDPPDYGLTKE
jgi:hypothetical protein